MEQTQTQNSHPQPHPQIDKLDTMIDQQIKQSLNQSRNLSQSRSLKHKSKQITTLAHKNIQHKPSLTSEQILEKRFKQSKQRCNVEIMGLEKRCGKFGGSDYIRNQMDKQEITKEELFDFFRQRIKSIHGSLTLPPIQLKAAHSLSKLSPPKNNTNPPKRYNKWYVQPAKRFSIPQTQKQKISTVTRYMQKILIESNHNKKVSIKAEYAPIIVKESSKRLGRDPVICSYAEIKRR